MIQAGHDAAECHDGDTAGRSCHTTSEDSPWLRLDFAAAAIRYVQVTNIPSVYANRLGAHTIGFQPSAGAGWTER